MTQNTVSYVKWEAGAHTSFHNNIYDTLKHSIFNGMNSTQFFLGNPKSFKRHRATQEDIDKSKKLIDHYPLNVFSHFPYVANLAGSVKQLAWAGDLEQDEKTNFILKELEYELKVLSNFKSKRNGVIIHPGNYNDRKVGISTIAKSINKINFANNSKLILENAAGKGCSLATTFQEIKEIYDQILPEKQKYIGVCVDTAHICGYGEYDISKCSEVNRMFKEFDKIIGIEHFALLHLNDSVVCLGSKKDVHACLGTGKIWENNFDSLILLLETCNKHNIPIILETNGLDMLILALLSDSSKKK